METLERKVGGCVNDLYTVKCQWWGRQGGSGAFSSTAEVWDGGWRPVTVSGCLLRSLLKSILWMTAGGKRRASEAE